VIDGVSGSREFFDIAFFAVLVSTLVQGVTLEPLARRLGLTEEGDSVDGVEPEVSPEEARSAAQEGARLIDVRRDEEWAAGRIGGAEHVRLDQVQQRAAELTDRPVVFYCQTGERSGMAAQAFRGAGQEAASLAGGLAAWEAAGLPVET
jgi:rhodanese-related sulfurtransferase